MVYRYVDIAEAIDEHAPDSSGIDVTDYQNIDGIPLDGPLPMLHYVVEEVSISVCLYI